MCFRTPQFVVFYNGIEKRPEYSELKLSDLYTKVKMETALELKVKVININLGMNEELKKRCPIIAEYSTYVETVREYASTMPTEDAVIKAVDDCIKNNILRDFLLQQKAEVISMSIFEYDEEKEMERIKKDIWEQGLESGIINTILTYKEFNVSKDEAASKVASRFNMDLEKVRKLVEEHWDKE